MNRIALQKTSLLPRIQGIQEDLVALKKIKEMPLNAFEHSPYFGDANFRLHRILEGIFNIGNHILIRMPGAARGLTRYGDIAEQLGQHKIVPKDFANGVLKKMAGYRNRLVHGYAQITPEETQSLLRNHLNDIEDYLKHIKAVMEHPDQWGLTIE